MMRWRFWRSKQRDTDLDDEIAYDLAAEAEERIRLGISRKEAEAASRRDFGNVLLLKEDIREMWRWTSLERLGQDVRYGFRTLCKNPLFGAMAVLSLALGIGANTAMYSVMDAIMLRALPVPNPGELVILNWRTKTKQDPAVVQDHTGTSYDEPGGGKTSPDFPWPFYELLRNHNGVFSTLFAYEKAGQLNLVVHGQAELATGEFVSGNFFSGLGIVPAVGRLIAESDNHPGASQVAVLSYYYWRDRFAGDPAAIGQTVRINDIPFTVTGVAAPEFFGVTPGSAPVVYVPIVNRPSLARNYGNEHDTMFIDSHFYWADMMGRLRPGIRLARAQAELAAQFHRFALSSAANDKERADLPALWLEEGGSGVDSLRRQYSRPLLVLMTMVVFILAIACANIANLLLARATARRREVAVRLSLGASRIRVVRQLLTESMLLALPGGILGLGIAAGGIRFLIWLLAGGREDFNLRAELDWRVLAFTIAVAFATGIFFGLAPAIAATRVDITPALKESRASAARRRGRRIGLSEFLVASQIALSLLLVLGAAIFVRTLANLHAVEIGFNQENVLTFSLDASQAGYQDAALRAFYARMNERFRVLPGVRAATVTDMPLVAGANHWTRVVLPGAPKQAGRDGPDTSDISVGPTFFETMELPILLGRPIDSHDVDGAPLAAVVNQVFAQKYFPNQNPIGRRFGLGNSEAGDLTIVGIAKNARYSSLKQAIPPVTYISYLQKVVKRPPIAMTFELRTVGNPLSLAQSIRKAAHEAAPRVPVTGMMTQTQRIDNTIVQERTFADLCTAFAVLALLIACVGLYGTTAYAVARRTNEIGIRMALGAQRQRIVWMVLREVLTLATTGLAVGLICALSAMSAIKSFVFGMKPADPFAILLAAGILIAALLLAGFAPAMRASRIDPLTALRDE
ncbi:MAG TPA: ABC transporter permease [Bryobacteraceae bacterium]|nr:ABC transporter permease [Bryobacteraceae bacterium]